MPTASNGLLQSNRKRSRARLAVKFALDAGVLASSLFLAYALRFDFQISPSQMAGLVQQVPLVVIVQFTALWATGARRAFWRYFGLADFTPFLKAAALWSVPMLATRLLLDVPLQQYRLPLSVTLLDTMLALGGVISLRIIARAVYEDREKRSQAAAGSGPSAKRVLLVGAGRAGVLSVREIRSRGDMGLDPIGFVDDDRLKVGSVIGGVRVLGTTEDLPALVCKHDIDHVIITIAAVEWARIRSIVDVCERVPIKVRTIPGYYDLLQGNVSIRRIRDVDVNDLLGRDVVELDTSRLRDFLTDKRVMVTGAGGSIGSELARQVARFHPARLLLVERSEPALFEIERKLSDAWPELEVLARLADICDGPRMRGLLEYHRPDVVIHAAAHKHVTMMERQPSEAIKNNVGGTAGLAELSAEVGVGTFVLISTDKAVRPTSVMGASKRVAELVVQSLDSRSHMRCMAVRFGNVLGSTGSVVPIFTEQIARGGPVTVTHQHMTRYFMSIPEAAQLVLDAAATGEGGEIFVLDMGQPVSIVELAEKMIRLSGYVPHEDIDIIFTGARGGEKLAEELGHASEQLVATANSKIFVGKLARYDPADVGAALRRLRTIAEEGNSRGIRTFLNEFISEASLEVDVQEIENRAAIGFDAHPDAS